MALIRQICAPLFRHDFVVDPSAVRLDFLTYYTTLECSRCGRREEFPTLDRAAFLRLYRMRGCPGRTDPSPEVKP